jgi:TPR repeat protein
MGILYEQGLSVDQNTEAAFRCFFKAADLGCTKSNTKIGHMLYSGIRARKFQDLEDEDVQLFMATEASHADIEDAKYVLRPDRLQALKRYLKSAKNGDSEAANCAGLMLEKINPIDAVDCYRRALEINEKNTDAMLNMALLYYTTKEEKEWHEEAVRLIQRASDLGNEKAH